ncbi:FecCD family ABC transporter permease [Kibdelosporangium aridum]|uniref:Iron complex transport system permease protein n=1 Tax=Kibdelosporangium aridum TaxID=2030 RepID=A0A1W2FRE4_KIBAR|nr:iron chelate uptake ABC transporter family permease subunit [Kibdelosporangium aridum]SMD24433.1 iron complex transport system permease protein [Kibdelosporangium aridum]
MSVNTAVRGRPIRISRLSLRLDIRATVTCLIMTAAIIGLGFLSMTTGDYPLTVPEVVDTVLGQGPPGADFIVMELRLPRLLAGLLVGAAFGISGAIMQRLTDNPLGSPDIIGFTAGSATGALSVIVLTDGGMMLTAGGALAGGIVTSILIYLLAYRRGVQGFRLVLIGIGISAMLFAANEYLITHASLQDALAAAAWQVGGLNGRGWEHVEPVAWAMVALLPFAVFFSHRLSILQMGDDAAKALGVRVESTRLVLVMVSVALAAVGTAAAGPIAFVALAAPQIAKRLAGTPSAGPIAAGAMGALLLMTSDFVVQKLFSDTQLPVGIATAVIGGLYLAWLLAREFRRR